MEKHILKSSESNNIDSASKLWHDCQQIMNRECQLLQSIPQNFVNGIVKRTGEIKENPLSVAPEVLTAAGITAAAIYLRKNPKVLVTAIQKFAPNCLNAERAAMHLRNLAPKIGLGLAGMDLFGIRLGVPMYDTAVHPKNLDMNKIILGNNLGSAAVDYPLMALSGASTALASEVGPTAISGMKRLGGLAVQNLPVKFRKLQLASSEGDIKSNPFVLMMTGGEEIKVVEARSRSFRPKAETEVSKPTSATKEVVSNRINEAEIRAQEARSRAVEMEARHSELEALRNEARARFNATASVHDAKKTQYVGSNGESIKDFPCGSRKIVYPDGRKINYDYDPCLDTFSRTVEEPPFSYGIIPKTKTVDRLGGPRTIEDYGQGHVITEKPCGEQIIQKGLASSLDEVITTKKPDGTKIVERPYRFSSRHFTSDDYDNPVMVYEKYSPDGSAETHSLRLLQNKDKRHTLFHSDGSVTDTLAADDWLDIPLDLLRRQQ